jgi:hypothetical protein
MTIADRAAGALQGAADAATGAMHPVRAWHSEREPDGRMEAARARWEAGLPARNTFERDAYASIENSVAAGMNRLAWHGKQASEMEAAMTKKAESKEAGS